MNNRFYSLLGICQKSGNLVSGETGVLDSLRRQKAHLVLVSRDASDRTKRLFQNKCNFFQARLILYGEKDAMGKAIGHTPRSSVAVTDKGLADALYKIANEQENGRADR